MYQVHPIIATTVMDQRHRDFLARAQASRLARAAQAATPATGTTRPRWRAGRILAFAR